MWSDQLTAVRNPDSLCFDRRQAKYIDRTDFLNAAMQEKKRFEGSLDDAVAAGMNAGVEVLMNQVSRSITFPTKFMFMLARSSSGRTHHSNSNATWRILPFARSKPGTGSNKGMHGRDRMP